MDWFSGRALASRNYRLYFAGQAISLVGTWMQQVALSWLVYRLTGSSFWLGVIGFASQIPTLLVAPLAGVAADRWNRRRALVATQSLAMLQAFVLLFVTWGHDPPVGLLLGLGVFLGIVNALDMPLRQSFLVEIIGQRERLPSAIALNSSIVNGARLVGPSLSGFLIAAWGESACFLLNALSYLAVLGSLLAMRDLPIIDRPRGKLHEHLQVGVRYAFGFAPIRALLIMTAVVSVMAAPLNVLMPVFAKVQLQGDATTQGLLTGALGLGALAGAGYLAARKTVVGLGAVVGWTAALFGLGLIAFSFAPNLPTALGALVATGFCMMLHLSACNTIIQTIVDEDKRGRVMSYYTMAFMGMTPIGSLAAGLLAERLGAPATVRWAAVACLISGVAFATQLPRIRRLVRPIYERLGILPTIPAPPAQVQPLGSGEH